MRSVLQKRSTILLILFAATPILLPLNNPSLEWGELGIFLGFWGLYISPVVIFGTLLYQWLTWSEKKSL